MSITEDNLNLWYSVSETPKEWVKPIPGRTYLSSIDAYYQIEQATNKFGPCGKGWGYTINELKIGNKHVLCRLVVWYILDDQKYELPETVKMQPLYVGKYHKFDEDACTKVITASLTKSLSFLGFGADVFQGRHDKKPPDDANQQNDFNQSPNYRSYDGQATIADIY